MSMNQFGVVIPGEPPAGPQGGPCGLPEGTVRCDCCDCQHTVHHTDLALSVTPKGRLVVLTVTAVSHYRSSRWTQWSAMRYEENWKARSK